MQAVNFYGTLIVLVVFNRYLVPLSVAFLSMVLRWITEWTCAPYSTVCKAGSELLSHIYAVVFCFLAIIALTKMKQIQEGFRRVQVALQALQTPASPRTKAD